MSTRDEHFHRVLCCDVWNREAAQQLFATCSLNWCDFCSGMTYAVPNPSKYAAFYVSKNAIELSFFNDHDIFCMTVCNWDNDAMIQQNLPQVKSNDQMNSYAQKTVHISCNVTLQNCTFYFRRLFLTITFITYTQSTVKIGQCSVVQKSGVCYRIPGLEVLSVVKSLFDKSLNKGLTMQVSSASTHLAGGASW